jgi:signal transduction histidine kinase
VSVRDARISELEAEVEVLKAALDAQSGRSEQLEHEEGRVQALYDNFLDMVLSLDRAGVIQRCNRSASERFGGGTGALIGQSVLIFLEPESGAALVGIFDTDFEGAGESEVSLLDGTKLGFSISRIDGASVQLVLRDITPMERLQEELLNTRRMASVGQLAGGIAHEINNPLAVIQGRVEMLRAVPDMPAQTQSRHLDVLEDHCQRVSRIVRNLHTFARPRSPDPRWTSVASVVDNVVESLGRRLERVRFEVELPDELRSFADPNQLEQVLVNLISSATDASPAGRLVRLSGRDVGSGSVELRVDDEGPGLNSDILEGLRAPQSSGGVPVEAGRGLCLSISWGMVKDHGGRLTAENRLPRGTSVVFVLPGPQQELGEAAPQASRGRTVLVVDDDRNMCETIGWMLTTDGHRVVGVHSAEDALSRLEVERFDALITDLRLPGMDGEGLMSLVRSRWPELAEHMILTSGLLHRPSQVQRYLQKPFSQAQLLKLISELDA